MMNVVFIKQNQSKDARTSIKITSLSGVKIVILRPHARNRLGFVCHLDVKDYSLENYDFCWQQYREQYLHLMKWIISLLLPGKTMRDLCSHLRGKVMMFYSYKIFQIF